MSATGISSLPELSERLRHTAELVTPGFTFADIGTDHAYLPIYLTETLRCPGGFASDTAVGPLMRAENNINAHDLREKIKLLLGDGLAVLSPGDARSLVMAGMGGRLMIGILSRNMETAMSFTEMILQPQSEIEDVRRWIYGHGCHIAEEDIVFETGKYYFMIKAIHGIEALPDEGRLRYGPCLIQKQDPLLRSYLIHEKEKKLTIRRRLKPGSERRHKRDNELKTDIRIIDDLLEHSISGMTADLKEGTI